MSIEVRETSQATTLSKQENGPKPFSWVSPSKKKEITYNNAAGPVLGAVPSRPYPGALLVAPLSSPHAAQRTQPRSVESRATCQPPGRSWSVWCQFSSSPPVSSLSGQGAVPFIVKPGHVGGQTATTKGTETTCLMQCGGLELEHTSGK